MADKELSLPSQRVIENTLTVPFTFTVYHTDEQFTLQAGESVRFDIKSYGEYTYYEKICKEVELRVPETDITTYSFVDGAGKTVLADTSFVPYRENFTYSVKSGDLLIMPLDSLAKGAYYVNLGVGNIARSLRAGSVWTGSGRGNIADGIVFDYAGQKTVDGKRIDCYKAYGEVPYLQADMYFEAGNRVYFTAGRGATSQTVTIGGTTQTYDAKDYAFASGYTVFANPTGIVSVDVMKDTMGTEEHHYYEFDFTNTTNQAPHEGLGTVFVSNLTSSGSNYTFTVLNQPAEGLKVVGKVSEDGVAIPIEYHQDLSDWIEMTKDGGNWVLTDETPISNMAYVNIAYVTEDNLAVAGGAKQA